MGASLLCLFLAVIGADSSESIRFVGFSQNNALAAYRVSVTTPRPGGGSDRYGLIVVRRMPDRGVGGESVATYRDEAPVRFNARGRPVQASRSDLFQANPRFAQARPRGRWLSLARRARFRHERLPLDETILRLRPTDEQQLEANRGEQSIDVVVPPGSSIGFDTVVRKWSGEHVLGGRFRMPCEQGEQLAARVEAFHSPDGYAFATVTTFIVRTHGEVRQVAQAEFTTLIHSPVATTQIGTMRIAQENQQWGADWYNLRHPGVGDHYAKFVGERGRL